MNTTPRTRIQIQTVAQHLRSLGWKGTTADVREVVAKNGMGRFLRSPAMGQVVTQDELDVIVKEMVR